MDDLDFTVTLDGVQRKLADLDWALLKPCGCAEAIHLSVADDEVLATPQMAFAAIEPLKRTRDRMLRNGYTLKLMLRADALALFKTRCTHKIIFRAVVTTEREGGAPWVREHGPYASINAARGVATMKARSRSYWGISGTQRSVKVQRAIVTWEDM